MMRQLKTVLASLLCLMMACSLVACQPGSGENMSALVTEAMENMKAADSMELSMDMVMDLEVMEERAKMSYLMDVAMIQEPMKMKGSLSVDVAGNQIDTEVYMLQTDETMTTYMQIDGQWMKQEETDEMDDQTADLYNTQQNLNLYLEKVSYFKKVGAEPINGSNATKIQGTILGKDISKLMKESGMYDQMLSSLDEMEDEDVTAVAEAMFKDIGDVNMYVWVDEATTTVAKMELDMTDMAAKMFKNVFTAVGTGDDAFTVHEMKVGIECSNFNKVADFDIPEEALNAPTLEELLSSLTGDQNTMDQL